MEDEKKPQDVPENGEPAPEHHRRRPRRVHLHPELSDVTQVFAPTQTGAAPEENPSAQAPLDEASSENASSPAAPSQEAYPPQAPASEGNAPQAILVGIIVVLVIAIGAFAYKELAGSSGKGSNPSLAQQTSSSSGAAARQMQSELSLGGLDLDMPVDDVRKALGKEDSSEQKGKFQHIYYGTLDVGIYENTVHALVSDDPQHATKRGIHPGSTLDEVKKAYGTDYAPTDYEDKILYEYTFRSLGGHEGLLRFAVKKSDNTVAYISVRMPEDEKQAPQQKQSAQQVDSSPAKAALSSYYQSISDRRMRDAYSTLSSDMQNQMGSFESFSQGYQTTLSNSVSNIQVVSAAPGKVVLTYTLMSRDRMANKRVKVQTFSGQATLSSASGRWHIVDMNVKKQGEHME